MNENNQENWLFCIDWLIHVDLFNLVFHAKKVKSWLTHLFEKSEKVSRKANKQKKQKN